MPSSLRSTIGRLALGWFLFNSPLPAASPAGNGDWTRRCFVPLGTPPTKGAPAPARTDYEFRPEVSIERSELDSDLASLIGAGYPVIFELAGKPDPHRTIESILDRYASAPPDAVAMVKEWSTSSDPVKKNAGLLLEKIIKLYDSKDPQAALYFEKLGHNRAIIRGKQEIKAMNPAFDWPDPPEGVEGEYWDMASGLVDLTPKFTAGRAYRLFDASPYVSRQLATLGKINHLNYVVEQKDIRTLQRPEKPIAALRIKNAATYAKGFQDNLIKMADWIAPKGQILLQEDDMPIQLARTVHRYGSHIKELMRKGWKFEFHGYMKPYYYYTIRLTRPEKEGPVDPLAVDQQWNEFMQSVPILKRGNLEQYEKGDDD